MYSCCRGRGLAVAVEDVAMGVVLDVGMDVGMGMDGSGRGHGQLRAFSCMVRGTVVQV